MPVETRFMVLFITVRSGALATLKLGLGMNIPLLFGFELAVGAAELMLFRLTSSFWLPLLPNRKMPYKQSSIVFSKTLTLFPVP